MTAGGLGGLRQYNRRVVVRVGKPGTAGAEFDGLRVNFDIQKTDSKKPSKGKIQIYNLSEASTALFEEEGAQVFLLAGYDNPDLLFTGDIDEVERERNEQDIITTIEAADGRSKYQSGMLFETFDAPLDSTLLLRRLASNIPIAITQFPPNLRVIEYTQGYTIAGPIRDALDEITESLDARWSIQDGELLITPIGQATPQQAALVSPSTGLIGTPKKTKKGLKWSMLLNGQIKPRRTVKLEAETFRGFYLVRKVTHRGDSGFDTTYYTQVEAEEIGQ